MSWGTMTTENKNFLLMGLYILSVIAVGTPLYIWLIRVWGLVVASILVLIGVGGGVYFLSRWQVKHFAFVCPKCHSEFMISPLREMTSLHMGNDKRLACPNCHVRSWCRRVALDSMAR